MADPICVASTSRSGDLILRWYPSVEHYGRHWMIASASEWRSTTHPYIAEVPPEVQLAATRAQRLIADGNVEQARQMATHRVVRFLWARRLEPVHVVPPSTVEAAAEALLRGGGLP